eukprot:Gb_16951 [translate_table: standard]
MCCVHSESACGVFKFQILRCPWLVDGGKRPDLVIGADTVVELNGKILEKPQDENDAFHMLSSLSGCQHKVYTGVSLVLSPFIPDPKLGDPPLVRTFWEETKVEFANIDEAAINAYIESGEPMDKAGGSSKAPDPMDYPDPSRSACFFISHNRVKIRVLERKCSSMTKSQAKAQPVGWLEKGMKNLSTSCVQIWI